MRNCARISLCALLSASASLVPMIARAQAETDVVAVSPTEPEPDAVMALPPPGGETGATVAAPVQPEVKAISPGNVDMRAGGFSYSVADLVMGGPGDEGMQLTRSFGRNSDHAQPFGVWFTHNWNMRLVENRVQVFEANTPGEYDYQITIDYGSLGTTFRKNYVTTSGMFRKLSNDGYGKLTWTGGLGVAVYTFTASDGTVVVFNPMQSTYSDCDGINRCAYPRRLLFL